MSAKTLVQIVNAITAESGSKAKMEILAKHKDYQPLLAYLQLTYNPLHTFGVKKVTPTQTGTMTIDALITGGVMQTVINTNPNRLTGNSAIDALTKMANSLYKEDQELFIYMLARNARIGLNATSINKVYGKEVIYDPTKHYMRCSGAGDVKGFNYAGALVQEKMDGAYIEFDTLTGMLRTRAGSVVLPSVSNITPPQVQPCTIMGEILFVGDNGEFMTREDSNGVLNSLISGNTTQRKIVISIYDAKNSSIVDGKPYVERMKFLEYIVPKLQEQETDVIGYQLTETFTVQTEAEARKIALDYIAQGKEGAVVKEAGLIWKAGTSKQQIKLKVEAECDLRIKELVAGDPLGKHASTFGSLLCVSECGKLLVNVSGITDEQRQHIYDNQSDWIGKVVAVKYNTITQTNETESSLFLPRLNKDSKGEIQVRTDKATADTLEEIVSAYNSLIGK